MNRKKESLYDFTFSSLFTKNYGVFIYRLTRKKVRIEFLYERATSKLCLTEALWEEYIQWARQIKSPNLLNIVTRATRNCTWCARLWVTRLKVAETQGVESAIINDIKDKALVAIEGSQIQDYISILKTYILFFKRKLQQETTDENKDGFRTAIRTAIKYIGKYNHKFSLKCIGFHFGDLSLGRMRSKVQYLGHSSLITHSNMYRLWLYFAILVVKPIHWSK